MHQSFPLLPHSITYGLLTGGVQTLHVCALGHVFFSSIPFVPVMRKCFISSFTVLVAFVPSYLPCCSLLFSAWRLNKVCLQVGTAMTIRGCALATGAVHHPLFSILTSQWTRHTAPRRPLRQDTKCQILHLFCCNVVLFQCVELVLHLRTLCLGKKICICIVRFSIWQYKYSSSAVAHEDVHLVSRWCVNNHSCPSATKNICYIISHEVLPFVCHKYTIFYSCCTVKSMSLSLSKSLQDQSIYIYCMCVCVYFITPKRKSGFVCFDRRVN